MTLETEVKFYLPDLERVRQQLEALGAVLEKPRLHELNIRYDDAVGNLSRESVVLRLRQDDRARVTYKAEKERTGGVSTRLELETEVADFKTMDDIFRRLGYVTHLEYEKYRTTYTLYDAEIVLDEMPYGNFIEIEGEQTAIEQVITALNLQHIPRILDSYTVLFRRVQDHLGLTFRDLTFANFAGISVPGEIFTGLS